MHVLAEAAIERPGLDLPDARVRAHMTGGQIFSIRADVHTMAEVEERAEVMHARPTCDVKEHCMLEAADQALSVGGESVGAAVEVGRREERYDQAFVGAVVDLCAAGDCPR